MEAVLMFVGCRNEASISLLVNVGDEISFVCPYHVGDEEYCEYKSPCVFRGKILKKEYAEYPMRFEGTVCKEDEEEFVCGAMRLEDFLRMLIDFLGD